MELIDKAAVVAEIKRKIRTEQGYSSGDAECGYQDCAREILSFLDTLEVKEEAYVITRSEEHADYVEAVFLSESKAEEYCKPFNEDENRYARNITEIEIQ